MSNNKQSSVDFLIKQKSKYGMIIDDDLRIAKAMHKEEHGQTWDKSLDNLKARGMNEMRAYTDFDEYYEQTYESNS